MNGCYVCVCGRRRLATAAQSSVFNWRPGSKSGRWPSLFVKVELPLVHLPLERYPVSFLRDPTLHPVDRGRMPWRGAPPSASRRVRRRVRHVSPALYYTTKSPLHLRPQAPARPAGAAPTRRRKAARFGRLPSLPLLAAVQGPAPAHSWDSPLHPWDPLPLHTYGTPHFTLGTRRCVCAGRAPHTAGTTARNPRGVRRFLARLGGALGALGVQSLASHPGPGS